MTTEFYLCEQLSRYNFSMARFKDIGILSRIFIPLLLITISGIGARAHSASSALQQAHLAIQTNQHASAAEWLASAAEQLPYRADLWENAGQQAMLAGNPGLAIEYFSAAVDLHKLSFERQIVLGEAYQQIGDLEQAIQIWESTTEANPDPHTYELLASAKQKLGNYDQAVEYLRSLISLQPSNATAQYQLGLLLAVTDPSSASAHLLLAFELDNRYIEQVAVLQSALRSAQFDNPPAYVFTLVGQALGALGEWELARTVLQRATEEDPTYAEAWAYLGAANQQTGEDGLIELEVAYALDPNSLSANILLSLYWQAQNQSEEALFYLQNAARLDPTNPALYADLGALFLRMGDQVTALALYQRATELASQDPRYWILLANFSVEHEIYLEEAGLPAALEAYALAPDDPQSAVLVGRAYFLLGDYPNSLDYFLRALSIDPDYAPAHLHLGILYVNTGEHENGRLEFQRVIELDGDGKYGLFAKQLLAQYFP
ncbi:MAG: tetratricopeptide repeat protein [Chloroflexi bacterium]|nr:tetratricopeptide repeat protein [Chloroflexota bacterium]